MSLKYIKINITNIVFIYFFIVAVFCTASYKFIISDYIILQKEKNKENIEILLEKMNSKVKNIATINNDYSKWDDTYTFIQNKNNDYIYENFREGTFTLKELNIDFMIYSTLDNIVMFSTYKNEILNKNNKRFEKYLLQKFNNKNIINKIIKYDNQILLLSKVEIKNSDKTLETKGYIYSGRIVNIKELKKNNFHFKEMYFTTEQINKPTYNVKFSHLNNVSISSKLYNETITNTLVFSPNISLIVINDTLILSRGKITIAGYNIVISIILLLLFFGFYRNQIRLQNYNRKLQIQVNKRTKELNKSLRTVKKKNKELYAISNTDYLTQVRNRRNFFKKSEILLEDAINEDKNFSVLMIDIDHFKKINDAHGHSIGDKVLITFCKIVNSIISKNEIFGRLGGEEFCISFYDEDIEIVNKIAEEIRENCSNKILILNNESISFTISIGLSSRGDSNDIDHILNIADSFLYKAKDTGRNRIIRS